MTRSPALAYSLASFAVFAAAATSQAQTTLSAAQIVDKNIAARGGHDDHGRNARRRR
jgi:hypothetical protein